jgi:hypothetical protein
MVDRATQERWNKALDKKGARMVQADLESQPGRPTDVVYDIGDQPPYPTRDYCARWALGDHRQSSGVARYVTMVTIFTLLFVVCVIQTIGSFSKTPHPPNYPSPAPMPHGGSASAETGIRNDSVISTTDNDALIRDCSAVSASNATHTVNRRVACAKTGPAGGAPHS